MIEIRDEHGLVWAIRGYYDGSYVGFYEDEAYFYLSAKSVYEAVKDSTTSGYVPQEVTEWLGLA